MSEDALRIYWASAGVDVEEGAEKSEKESQWSTLEEQLYRRWEILAVCHSKTGDRKVSVSHWFLFMNVPDNILRLPSLPSGTVSGLFLSIPAHSAIKQGRVPAPRCGKTPALSNISPVSWIA